MAHTTRTTALRQALRREAPATLGLLTDARDFAAMRRYRTFTFDDHPTYLREVEHLLKTLAADGTHTTVTLFDPEEYAAYCAETGLDPDTRAGRTRYTAEIAARGVRVPYTGQPVDELVPSWSAPPCATPPSSTRPSSSTTPAAAPTAARTSAARPSNRRPAPSCASSTRRDPAHTNSSAASPPPTTSSWPPCAPTARPPSPPASTPPRARRSSPSSPPASPAPPRADWSCAPAPRAPPTASTAGASTTAASSPSPRPRSSTPTAPTPTPEILPPEPGVEYRAGFDLAPDDGRPTHH